MDDDAASGQRMSSSSGRPSGTRASNNAPSWQCALSSLNEDVDLRLKPDQNALEKHHVERNGSGASPSPRVGDASSAGEGPGRRLSAGQLAQLSTDRAGATSAEPSSGSHQSTPRGPSSASHAGATTKPWYMPFGQRGPSAAVSDGGTPVAVIGSVNGMLRRKLPSVEEGMDDAVEMPARSSDVRVSATRRTADSAAKR